LLDRGSLTRERPFLRTISARRNLPPTILEEMPLAGTMVALDKEKDQKRFFHCTHYSLRGTSSS
jgi:hypothetical protein